MRTAPSNMISAGTYVFEPSMIDRVPVDARLSVERAVFPVVAAEGRLYALCTDDYWIDTGRPELYRQANLDAVSGIRHGVHEAAIGPGARVDGWVDGSVVGAGAVVEAGADRDGQRPAARRPRQGGRGRRRLGAGPGAEVGPGAVLDDVVLGSAAVGRGW